MRLVTFVPPDGHARAGALLVESVIDLASAAPLVLEEAVDLRWDLLSLLQAEQDVGLDTVEVIVSAVVQMLGFAPTEIGAYEEMLSISTGSVSLGGEAMVYPLDQVSLLAPLPRPASLRIYASFEEHALAVASLRESRLTDVWYRGPAFSFANHGAVYGPGAEILAPPSDELDYGLGLGCVIGQRVRDVSPETAREAIAGYIIINTWTARDYETEEQALGLGPIKARDFATSLGPWLVTPDELELYADDQGRMSLAMIARVNGIEMSRTTAALQYYSFAEMIAHASRNVTLYPGDVLGTGAVGGGSLFERTNGYGPWLAQDDIVDCEISGLGTLSNRII